MSDADLRTWVESMVGSTTGIDELPTSAEKGGSSVYYNLQGTASLTPHEGLNVVVTRTGNGTTTRKVMK